MIINQQVDDLTGLKTTYAVEDGKLKIDYRQDISGDLERNQKLRDAEGYTKNGIKNDFWHVAHIPDSVCMKMMVEDGFNPYSAQAKDIVSFLRRNKDKYSQLLVTTGQF